MKELITKDYLGKVIEFKTIDGLIYANATSMCSPFENGSQKLKDWKRSPRTLELIDELNKINDVEKSHHGLILSEKGSSTLNGTWIEENLLLDFAQYLNVSFKVWCQKQITTLLREGTVSLKPKTEEEMLLELFPKADMNLVTLTAQNIREVKTLTKEVIHKENVIVGLVDNIDLTTKRQRITQIVRFNSKNYQDRYTLLYSEFQKKYHLDLNKRIANCTCKPKIKNKMDYIDRIMNKIPELYEIACKVFENDLEILKKEWTKTIIREDL